MYANTPFDLTGRVALVSGGAGLLGREFCRALVSAGATTILLDKELHPADAAADYVAEKEGVRPLVRVADVTDRSSVRGALESLERQIGDVPDVLINSAAIDAKFDASRGEAEFAAFPDFPLEQWGLTLNVNLTGMLILTQEVCRGLERKGQGSIINLSSIYAMTGPDQTLYSQGDRGARRPAFKPPDYSVTKAGVLGFTRYLAAYYAGTKIRVNTLTPGGVFNGQEQHFVRQYGRKTMLGRMADKEEFRGAILFLASDASSYMTGANLVIDGGWSAW